MPAKTDNTYSLPVPTDNITEKVLDTTSGSHSGAYEGAVDFAVPVGTPVLAALNGKVVRVRDDSDKYGETSDFGQDVNYVTVEHENSELSEYLHLAKDSVTVKIGDVVRKGQTIASTGLSGWMFAPHLHFQVYKQVKKPKDFQCLSVIFE